MSTPEQQSREHLSTDEMAAASEHSGRQAERREGSTVTISSADAAPVKRQSADTAETERHAPLFNVRDADTFRGRWSDVQAGFVDEPRRAVEQADGLVAEVMKQLAQGFADERSNLESQWDRGEATETEELRLALRRYRSFFDRLLSV
jgi:hypothetical protein